MGSTRLPGKVLKEVSGVPLLAYMVERVRLAKDIGKIVIATSTEKEDNVIETLCKKVDIDCFRGSEEDVLDRYWQCARKYPNYDTVIRLTGDCPLVDPILIDKTIEFFEVNNYDHISSVPLEGDAYPEGMDIEVFTRHALEQSWCEAKLPSEREHVTLYVRNNDAFKKGFLPFKGKRGLSSYRLTVDNPEDFEVISFLMKKSGLGDGYMDYVKLLDANPEIRAKNMNIERNAGLKKSLAEDKVGL